MNIKLIPLDDLLNDKEESLQDIIICQNAINYGVYYYSGGKVIDRLNTNKKIVQKIDDEIGKRKRLTHSAE